MVPSVVADFVSLGGNAAHNIGVIAESVLNRTASGIAGTRSAAFAGPRNPLFEPFGRSDVVGIEAGCPGGDERLSEYYCNGDGVGFSGPFTG